MVENISEKLYNKYRFTSLDEIVGNLPHKQKLQSDIERKAIDQVYLFHSKMQGVGKTSCGRLVSKELSKVYLDEIDIASDGGAAKAREIVNRAADIPIGYRSKLVLIDEPQNSKTQFWDALLKVIEEPPKNVYFVFCTTEIGKIPANIKSRCTKLEFTPPSTIEMKKHLKMIVRKESLDIPDNVLSAICKKNKNIPRDCISAVQALIGIAPENQLNVIEQEDLEIDKGSLGYKIAVALNGKKSSTVQSLVKDMKDQDCESARYVIKQYFCNKMGNKWDKDTALILDSFKDTGFPIDKAGFLVACCENL